MKPRRIHFGAIFDAAHLPAQAHPRGTPDAAHRPPHLRLRPRPNPYPFDVCDWAWLCLPLLAWWMGWVQSSEQAQDDAVFPQYIRPGGPRGYAWSPRQVANLLVSVVLFP